jgi:hypothetical protein
MITHPPEGQTRSLCWGSRGGSTVSPRRSRIKRTASGRRHDLGVANGSEMQSAPGYDTNSSDERGSYRYARFPAGRRVSSFGGSVSAWE